MANLQFQYDNECFLLGAILQEPELIEEVNLLPAHFIHEKNRALFQNMLDLYNQGKDTDIISLSQQKDTKVCQFGGKDRLRELYQSVPSLKAFSRYQDGIRSFHAIFKAQDIAHQFLNECHNSHEMIHLETMIRQLSKLEASTVKKQLSFHDQLKQRVINHHNSPTIGLSGVHTGFKEINAFTDGWQPADLIIVGGRPSMGKTAFVLNSLLYAAKQKPYFSTLFSIEMASDQIIDRLIAMEGRINLMKLRNPNKVFQDQDWEKYSHTVGELERLNFDIREEYTVPDIRAAVRKNMKDHPEEKHVVAIDFLTLLKHPNPSQNTHKDVTDIVQDLKQMAKDLKIPVIVLAQLNRGVEKRLDKRPNMSDLRESGSIEQIADVVTFLYRDGYYQNQAHDQRTEVIIAKNRNGATGTIPLTFEKETNTFFDEVKQ
ncbi:AAA family ATPase [Virgibacillus sp. MSP4-1]|uniref:replicative DNA helicase n=1 Tax=Virgibacillus sp. MSP4-1 TaxID=2700081 RepID=UPI0003A51937|nr:DnaB-like helicase C-terminal domain-containing protein [Virgibacillus sp. MSP4-1]QHS22018.1 AAA family ATPase [Virgibacillus sp. MSP4-1]